MQEQLPRTSRIESRDGLGRAKQEPEPRVPRDGFTTCLCGYTPRVAADQLPQLSKETIVNSGSRPISRVLSWAIIHLGLLLPASSSDLPEDIAGRDIVFLFGLAPGGVYHATSCYQLRGALLPHHFTLTCHH